MFRRLALPPLGKPPIVFAVLVGGLLPIAIAVGVVLQVSAEKISPAMMLLVQAGAAAVSLAIVLPMWRREAAFDGKHLRVKATYYTRQAALPEFDLAAARVVDLREHTEFKPVLKTNGFSVPGLQAGHFRLRDKRAAFCLVTDPARVLCLPHADGRLWMLSLTHPQAVLDILRRAAA
ncbi:hypothetical protein [Arenimonas sp.]|uniref:hypothetical protein n=1 Tax=Arenimonas sp. TaxID=1872635 RepID=UPI002E30282A|nr:hypothetical protein [Arenimonas sp.]HEX4852705.1 hypothetical protein [Arenimonas sp.]